MARGQTTCSIPSNGCSPPVQASQCFPGKDGPSSWTDPGGYHTTQTRTAVYSLLSTCHGPIGDAQPSCCNGLPSADGPNPKISLRVVKNRIFVDYEAPNLYCTNNGDWPPFYTCVNDPFADPDSLALLDGDGNLIRAAFVYFEKGTWDTGIDIACGAERFYETRLSYADDQFQLKVGTARQKLEGCQDRNPCPTCGVGGPNTQAGNPIHLGSGDVSYAVPLAAIAQSPMSLALALTYHSAAAMVPGSGAGFLGPRWTHTFAETLIATDGSKKTLYRTTGNGLEEFYSLQSDGAWHADFPGTLRGSVEFDSSTGQYLLTDLDGNVTRFDDVTGAWLSTTDRWGNVIEAVYSSGVLTSVVDTEGRSIMFAYSGGLLAQVTLPDGQAWRFTYSGGTLSQIFDPMHTGTTPWRTLSYTADSNGAVDLLSQVQDESGAVLEGHTYDASDRGITSSSAGGRDLVTIEYDAPSRGQNTVIHEVDGTISQQSVFSLIYQRGQYLPLTIVGDCATCGGGSDSYTFRFDQTNNVTQMVDAGGHTTDFQYDANGSVTSRNEAAGTAEERTTTFSYSYPSWPRFWTEKDEPSVANGGAARSTTRAWTSSSSPETTLTVTESGYLDTSTTAAYTTTSTFDDGHRLLTTTGPRTDVSQVTSRTYYPDADAMAYRRGRLAKVVDPVGLTTTYDNYDAYGTAKTITDPNGVATQVVTDARGRVTASISKAVAGDSSESTDYTTTYTFDGRDRLTATKFPRGNGLQYLYEDGTNRLTDSIRVDSSARQVERRHLTLNLIGDQITEEDQSCTTPATTCAAWVAKRSDGFVFDTHNRFVQVNHPVPSGSFLTNTYDSDGRLTAVQDENHVRPNTTYSFDALHRLTQVRQTLASAPSGKAVTSYGYDSMDNLASVTDPNGNTTGYTYDDFHRLARQDSPVTGETDYAYDEAGNMVGSIDGRGAATMKTFDADNRVVSSTAQLSGQSTETVSWTYDAFASGNYGRGRVASMTDPSGSTIYSYERRGLDKHETHTILGAPYTVSYQYDANGNRSGITYPSGRQVSYAFDFADRPVSAASGSTSLVSSASYAPFGPETQLSFGNTTTRTATFDQRYRPSEIRLAKGSNVIADYLYQEDAVGNITQIHDALDASYNRDFAYDDIFRLTGASTGYSLWGQGAYAYDAMGNMASVGLGSGRAATFAYNGTLSTLSAVIQNGTPESVTYDPAGNERTVGSSIYLYSPRNILVQGDGLSYVYDGRGVRAVSVLGGQAYGDVTGTVVNAATSAPLANVNVSISGTSLSTSTDSSGNFTLLGPAGTYTLAVSLRGYTTVISAAFPIIGGQSFAIGTIPLSVAPGTITGNVISNDGGGAVGNATVTVSPGGASVSTDAHGNFSISEQPGSYSVTIAKTGYTSQMVASFPLTAGEIRSLGTTALVPANATMTGTIVNSVTTAPIAGIAVTASPVAGGIIPTIGHQRIVREAITQPAGATTMTNGSGAFTLSVSPGTYNFTFSGAGYVAKTIQSVTLAPGGQLAFGSVPIDPMGTVTGRVISAVDGSTISGATVTVAGTLNSVQTDSSGSFAILQGPGTWTLSIAASGFQTLATPAFVLPAGGTVPLGTIELEQTALSVWVGYADNIRPSAAFPVPWQGSPNTVFIGNATSFWDAGAVRLDNNTTSPIYIDGVKVDLERPGPGFDLWGSFTVPARGSVILTQTTTPNFDTSDYPVVACGGALLANDPRIPKVTVTVGGVPVDYFDTSHVLDTGGFDKACQGNESQQWVLIGSSLASANRTFELIPSTGSGTLGSSYTLTASLVDAANQPVPNVTVTFTAVSGPDVGRTGTSATDISGRATFSYTGNISGTDTWQATITNASGGKIASNPATVAWPTLSGLNVFVGYADNLRSNPSFPTPWQGAPNTIFIGCCPDYDGGALRLDNTTSSPMSISKVTVDLQRPGPTWSLWGTFTIPANGSAILTQTAYQNFDTSDYGIVGCGGTVSLTDTRVPKITITRAGQTASYLDSGHILDTFGYDLACKGNESLQWRPVGSSSVAASGELLLAPVASTDPIGSTVTVTAIALDASSQPLPNVAITFKVLSGPDTTKTGTATTDTEGLASFSIAGATVGTDVIQASLKNLSGATILSNNASILWIPTVSIALAPGTATEALGTPYNATATVTDGNGRPVGNLAVTFEISDGPDQGLTLTATTNALGQAFFTFTGSIPGTDELSASVVGTSGQVAAPPVSVVWEGPTYYGITLTPPTQTDGIGMTASLTAAVATPGGAPAPGVPITFQVTEGPDVGTTLSAVTDSLGHASFSHSSTTLGVDSVTASITVNSTTFTSNTASVQWIGIPTTLNYTGPTTGEWSDPLMLSALLTETTTGLPIPSRAVTFSLGSGTASGTTNAQGQVSVNFTPTDPPASQALSVSFVGALPYLPSSTSGVVAIERDETSLAYTGSTTVALGQAQTLSAKLTDGEDGAVIAGKIVTFTLAGATYSATTDATGSASALVTLPASQTTGSVPLAVSFDGDTYEKPSQVQTNLLLYVPEAFVIWGGNSGGVRLNQPVNFWGNQWDKQVTGGDYVKTSNFKGYADNLASFAICEGKARTTGMPRLDRSCWTAKPGQSSPPEHLPEHIGVIVSTAVVAGADTIYGNAAALVVVNISARPPYGADPGKPGYGTLEAVIADPIGVVSAGPPSGTATPAITIPQQRFFLYTPELSLLAETELTSNASPSILYEYVWLNGHPVAQIDGGTAIHWTFTDHLGTPIMQTDSSGAPYWRAEYEPFGSVFSLRSTDQHQPLRFPGQEAEQFNLGSNGLTTKSYNIFRWYQPWWGRYAEADPLGLQSGPNPYSYALNGPSMNSDPTGLLVCRCQRHLGPIPIRLGVIAHDYLRIGPASRCEDNPAYGFFPNQRIPFGTWFFSPHGELVFGGKDRQDEVCSQLPCVDEGKALRALAIKAVKPGAYCILGLNCYNTTDSVLAESWKSGCCPAVPQIPPSFGLKGFDGR
jgi:RHS repeat-associated protein